MLQISFVFQVDNKKAIIEKLLEYHAGLYLTENTCKHFDDNYSF